MPNRRALHADRPTAAMSPEGPPRRRERFRRRGVASHRAVAAWNRELHSERDTSLRRFTHVDGKKCCYPAEDYPPSLDAPHVPPGRSAKSRKLWRVDGPVEDREWAELVGLHFRGNELIGEHFAETFPDIFTTP